MADSTENAANTHVDKNTMRDWKAQGKQKAVQYLQKKREAKGEARSAVKKEMKTAVKQWKESLKGLNKAEKKAQKKAYKAFKRRKNRTRTIAIWCVVVAVIAAIAIAIGPFISNIMGVLGTQKYVNSGAEADAVREAGYKLSSEICDEGFILLENDDSLLPLAQGTKLNIFGDDAYNFVYGGSGSAGASQSNAVSVFDALTQAGLEYNKDLDAAYRDLGLTGGGADGGIGAMVMAYLSGGETDDSDWHALDDAVINKAKDYSDTALIVLSAQEVESSEIDLGLLQPAKEGTRKAALIDKVCSEFDNVIFIINSGNVMEMSFMKDYAGAKAALWVGSPGSLGCVEMAKVLTGEVNPSGKTVDTWPVSIEAEPGYINYGNNTYTNSAQHVFTYDEGIYVGYRYYETWYGDSAAEYEKQVVYPFGYGLSYTTFDQEVTNVTADADTVSVTVNVTNTGDAAGKDIVQVYFSAPWSEESGIEKSAIELAAFGKTDELAPGASQAVNLTYATRDMASYSTSQGCYVLEAGEYKIVVGDNAHDALLSADETQYTYTAPQDVLYKTDEATGAEIENLFSFAEGNVTYMSRADKEGTFPKKHDSYTLTDEQLTQLSEYESAQRSYGAGKTAEPTYGAATDIKLADLKGLDYDDPKWDEFLDGFTIDEMINTLTDGGWHTDAIERMGVPQSHLLDGPSGINSMFSPLDAAAYPMETVISSSWNIDMATKLGEAIADEANVYGVNGWYAPALNIHRLSIGGRNSEYYSEDPLLAGAMGAASVQGAQSKGLMAMMKHFVCNDVELNARSDVGIWVSEQALREIYLQPFEMAVKEGGAGGAMSSFSRLGVEWCGGSDALLQKLLRDEWGFEGVVTTDACLGSWMNSELAVKNGNDLMLEMGMVGAKDTLQKAYKNDPVGVGWSARNSMHNLCYALVQYTNLCD